MEFDVSFPDSDVSDEIFLSVSEGGEEWGERWFWRNDGAKCSSSSAAEKGGYIYLANHHYVFLKNDPGFRYILTSQEVFATLLIKPTQGYDDWHIHQLSNLGWGTMAGILSVAEWIWMILLMMHIYCTPTHHYRPYIQNSVVLTLSSNSVIYHPIRDHTFLTQHSVVYFFMLFYLQIKSRMITVLSSYLSRACTK